MGTSGTDTSHIMKDYSGGTSTERGGFDPADIKKYHGYTFITEHSSYGVTMEGTFTGRESLDGGKIKLISGLKKHLYPYAKRYLSKPGPEMKRKLDSLIRNNAHEVEEGSLLVVSLTPESAEKKGRNGIVTSLIKKIKEPEYVH